MLVGSLIEVEQYHEQHNLIKFNILSVCCYLSYSIPLQLLVKNMNWIKPIIFLILLPLALTGITNFWDMTPIDSQTLLCLKDAGYLEQTFLLTMFSPQEQKWQVAVDPFELNKIPTKVNLIVSTSKIEGHLPPQLQAHRLSLQFYSQPISKYWISISNFLSGFKPTCSYLKIFALYLHLYTRKEIGFQSQLLFWEDLFGDGDACQQLGRYSLYLSFNRFKPFGGWISYEYFQTYRPVPVCNYPGMEVFRK